MATRKPSKNIVKLARKPGAGSKWLRPSKRIAIYARDGFCCLYCGDTVEKGARLTVDHIVPSVDGGTNDADNLATCCLSCNAAKQALSAREWRNYAAKKGIAFSWAAIRRQARKPLDRAAALKILAKREAAKRAA
jgi:5-methylcytosine-specific restriction endonuclease McrA